MPSFSLPEPVSAVDITKSPATHNKGGQSAGSGPSSEVPPGLDRSKVFHSSDGPVQKILDSTKEAV